jgi:hypothetical protein
MQLRRLGAPGHQLAESPSRRREDEADGRWRWGDGDSHAAGRWEAEWWAESVSVLGGMVKHLAAFVRINTTLSGDATLW